MCLNRSTRACRTEALRLHGWLEAPLEPPFDVYGANAPELINLLSERPKWRQWLHPRLPYRASEVIWAARHQSASQRYATSPDDARPIGAGAIRVGRWWGLLAQRTVPLDDVQTVSLERVVLRLKRAELEPPA